MIVTHVWHYFVVTEGIKYLLALATACVVQEWLVCVLYDYRFFFSIYLFIIPPCLLVYPVT